MHMHGSTVEWGFRRNDLRSPGRIEALGNDKVSTIHRCLPSVPRDGSTYARAAAFCRYRARVRARARAAPACRARPTLSISKGARRQGAGG
jgi:hypothetical protein